MKNKKTNEELVALIQNGTDVQENMALLLEQNHGLVLLIAKRMTTSTVVDLDDLIQEGKIGLMKAVDSYDESKGAFTGYAGFWIRGTIGRNTKSLQYDTKLPTYMVDLISKYSRFCAEYQSKNGYYPADEDLIKGLEISKRTLKDLRQTLKTSHSVSLDDAVPGGDDLTYGDAIADPIDVSDMVIESVYQKQCNEALLKHIKSLSSMQALVIGEHFFKNKSMREIAKKYNVSHQWIYQVEQKALELLRQQLEIKALVGNFDYRAEALKRTGFETWKDNMESSVERAFRKKEDWEIMYQRRIERINKKMAIIDALRLQLLRCKSEQRKEIESLFQRQFDEITPYVLNLNPKEQEAFIMIYVQEMRCVDAARTLNVTQSAIIKNKNRAVSKIKEALAV